ncbi:MAG TPA: hypothetical protein VH186_13975 [Chloroflexia bacterium]|nr:hypothetical protein [Chloroflexia bacterium]
MSTELKEAKNQNTTTYISTYQCEGPDGESVECSLIVGTGTYPVVVSADLSELGTEEFSELANRVADDYQLNTDRLTWLAPLPQYLPAQSDLSFSSAMNSNDLNSDWGDSLVLLYFHRYSKDAGVQKQQELTARLYWDGTYLKLDKLLCEALLERLTDPRFLVSAD